MEGIAACMTKNSFGWKFVVGFIVGVTPLFKSTVGSAASIEQNSSVQFAVTDLRAKITESLSPHLVLRSAGPSMRRDTDTDGILPLSIGGSATIRIFCTIVYVGTGRGPTISTRGTFARCSIRRSEFCQCMVIPLRFAWPVRTAELTATPPQTHTLPRE